MRTNCKARAIPYRTRKGYSKAYAKQNGFTNLRWYTDDGYSGPNFPRLGLQSMLADIEARKVGTVIVKDMSRLGRNYLQVGFYTEMLFPQKGVRFIAVNDNVDSANGGMDNDFTPCLLYTSMILLCLIGRKETYGYEIITELHNSASVLV